MNMTKIIILVVDEKLNDELIFKVKKQTLNNISLLKMNIIFIIKFRRKI